MNDPHIVLTFAGVAVTAAMSVLWLIWGSRVEGMFDLIPAPEGEVAHPFVGDIPLPQMPESEVAQMRLDIEAAYKNIESQSRIYPLTRPEARPYPIENGE